jgi:transcriptional regulator with XRE-family HTH domain
MPGSSGTIIDIVESGSMYDLINIHGTKPVYPSPMLHEQIREARIKAGLSQVKLAELAGIQRSLVQNLEDGRNVTIDTLRKVVPHLPSLRSLNLGSFELMPSFSTELRQGVQELVDAGQRLLDLIDNAPGTAVRPRRRDARNWQDDVEDDDPVVREAIAEAIALVEGGTTEAQAANAHVAGKKG